jgi:primosomal protein N' (replication factor Y)
LTLYAQVLLDLQVKGLKDRLFTYSVPEGLSGRALTGSQVLVPFGPKQMVLGYIVSTSNRYDGDFLLKSIQDVVDAPLFDQEYIDFLEFVSTKYCASMQDVVASAIPSCLTTRLKRFVVLNESYKTGSAISLNQLKALSFTPEAALLLELLRESSSGKLNLTILRQRFERNSKKLKISSLKTGALVFQKALRQLQQEEVILIQVEEEEPEREKVRLDLKLGTCKAATVKQKEVEQYFAQSAQGVISLSELLEQTKVSRSVITNMLKKNMLEQVETEVLRDALSRLPSTFSETHRNELPLTDEQSGVLDVLFREFDATLLAGGNQTECQVPYLLHGVTGSGKTEVYLRLITRALALGRRALFLVPEISLTPQLSGRLKARFGEQVAVWHSGISDGERFDTWRRLRDGRVKVLLGARSAILAHIPELGLIILDEEHDGSYKQSSPSPRYNARDLAIELGRRLGAFVLFGSATPDIGSFYQAQAAGRVLSMPNRVFKQAMPKVILVDMKEEAREGRELIVSRRLAHAIAKRLAGQEQVVLLMNRRGFANHVFCQGCGTVVKCKNCSVSLTVHRPLGKGAGADGAAYLACHHCNLRRPLLSACSQCQGPFIKESGQGTQKIEEEMRRLFPEARLVRLDSDITARKGAYEDVLAKFSQGQADILIGTQMVAKGLDIARVTLVGVLAADASFNLPDYRCLERGFQLITQVAGRAGRGDRLGEVILQTYTPELAALRLATTHDYLRFFEPELESRRDFDYPPFSRLLRVVVSGEDESLAEGVCEILAEEISNLLEEEPEELVKLLGPSPCLLEKIKGRFRYHLIVKNKGGERVQARLGDYLRHRHFALPVQVAIDVDAIDMI